MIRDHAREVRLLALGDSYTIGEAVAANARWPVRLAALLRERGMTVADPLIVARTGWMTDELSDGIDGVDTRGPFDIVTLLIGVNDQYRGRPVAQYREQFRRLLTRAIGFAGHASRRVIVVSIPDWGVTPFATGRDRARIGRDVDELNAAAREEAAHSGARYSDVTAISRRAVDEPGLIAHDGLHPSAAMYDEWARALLPQATAILER